MQPLSENLKRSPKIPIASTNFIANKNFSVFFGIWQISLKSARINANFTQSEVSEKLNISVSTLRRWEQKKTFPPIETIPAICELYGINYDNINFSK